MALGVFILILSSPRAPCLAGSTRAQLRQQPNQSKPIQQQPLIAFSKHPPHISTLSMFSQARRSKHNKTSPTSKDAPSAVPRRRAPPLRPPPRLPGGHHAGHRHHPPHRGVRPYWYVLWSRCVSCRVAMPASHTIHAPTHAPPPYLAAPTAAVGAWFGISLWVTFVAGVLLYKHLPRHTFGEVIDRVVCVCMSAAATYCCCCGSSIPNLNATAHTGASQHLPLLLRPLPRAHRRRRGRVAPLGGALGCRGSPPSDTDPAQQQPLHCTALRRASAKPQHHHHIDPIQQNKTNRTTTR